MRGRIPFNYYECEPLARAFAFIQSPSSGLRVEFSREAMLLPNEHGGRTAFYFFKLEGLEAVRTSWLAMVAGCVVAVGGQVDTLKIKDVDNDETVANLTDASEVLADVAETVDASDIKGLSPEERSRLMQAIAGC